MADDFPVRIRVHLTDSLRRRVSYDDAWAAAIAAHPPPSTDWTLGRPSVVDFMREAFRRAYHGQAVCGNIEPTDAKDIDERVRVVQIPRCRWGSGCWEEAKCGERFCGEHLAELHRIRDEIEPAELPDLVA